MPPLMITKLLPPRIGSGLIERPRLLELFSRNQELKLRMITAPAGYGKTVSILQYVNTLRTPFVWYQLDRYDNDPAVFTQYLIAGIERHFPGFGAETMQLVLQGNSAAPLRLIVIAFINELANLSYQDLTLVLDDYHLITTSAIHQFVQELLEHLPAEIRVIIASRSLPPLNFPRFRVAGEMMMIEGDTLRFTAPEASQFIAQGGLGLSREALDALLAKADGWPAALKLLTAPAVNKEFMLQPGREAQYLYDYLASEVLDQQTEEIRDFLVSTAVLETITPETCDLLLERNDSQSRLDCLEKQQLFLIPLAGQGRAYRYHQLFRDFLWERLGSRQNLLLRRAGKIAAQNGDWEHAVACLGAAGSDGELIPLIIAGGQQAFRQGRWQTVAGWLARLSREQIAGDEWLSLFQAKIHVFRGNLEEAEAWVGKSRNGFSARQDMAGLAECQFLQAKILNSHGRYQESLNLLEEAYPVLQKADPSLRFDLPLEKALLFIRMGRLRQAEELLQKGLQVAQRHSESWIAAHFLEGLGNVAYMLGEYPMALAYYQKATASSPNGIMPGYCADFTGFVHQELDGLDRAFDYIQKSIALKEKMGMNEALLPAYYQLGSFYIAAGEPEKTAAICHQAIRLITAIGGQRFFLVLHKTNLAWCLSFQGRLIEAGALFEETLPEAKAQSGVAWILCQMLYASFQLVSGRFAEAERLLVELVEVFEPMEFAQAAAHCYASLALLRFAAGDRESAGEYSHKLLALRSVRTLLVFFSSFDNVRPILRHGLEKGIEVPFIQRVFVLLGERGSDFLKELAAHPDAAVRARIVFPLAQLHTTAANELLQSLGRDPDPGIRRLIKQCAAFSGASGLAAGKSSGSPLIPLVQGRRGTPALSSEASPMLQIEMLGPPRIVFNAVDITAIKWRLLKSRDLLFYLAHQGKPVGVNQILADLWSDVPLEKSINLFYTALYWLRRIIQKDSRQELLSYAGKTCQLPLAFYTTDRQRFLTLINSGAAERQVSAKSSALLEEAVALYRGEYLSSLDYPWVVSEREHLKRLYLETTIRLAKFRIHSRDYLNAVKVLEPLTEQNPLREEIFGLLMAAYAALGDHLTVIRQYQQLKRNLDEELGIEPAPEITKLYYQLCGSNEDLASFAENIITN